jgi:glycosyltransferase involved in cell wall biosynthesis
LRRYFEHELAIKFSARFSGAELAAVVLAWLETPLKERQRLGRTAAARVARELDWSVVTGKAVDFAEEIVARRSGGVQP